MEAESSASQILGPGGPLSTVFDRYQPRPGQLSMADAVEQALSNEQVLFCEAGTGTGKTLAYLVPAILSGKKVVISTATRALQEQIFAQDLLLVEKALGRRVSAAVMKGLGNYLCKRRTAEFLRSDSASERAWASKLPLLQDWQAETPTGDFSELAALTEGEPLVAQLNSSSETRLGPRCAYFNDCFVTQMRQEAEAAQIVLVNHHLFFADLALRGPHPGRVLPDYDAVIFDEAHQVEDVATTFFGVRVTQGRVKNLAREATRLLTHAGPTSLSRAPNQVETSLERFFASLSENLKTGEPRVGVERDAWVGATYDSYLALDTGLEGLENAAEAARAATEESDSGHAEALETISRRCEAVRASLSTIVEGAPGRVTWMDVEGPPALSSTPVDLSETLRELVFNRIPTVVLTSATLTTSSANQLGGSSEDGPSPFRFVRDRLGADACEPEVVELQLPSAFNFKQHSMLYIPKDIPPPNDPEFAEASMARTKDLIEASDGGAFVLTTSHRSLTFLQRRLARELPGRPVLVQGSAPKRSLLSAFRASTRAVLIATMGFWEGVDIPGDALRLVVLEKIPFSVPSDPILKARAQSLESDHRNPFNELFVPLAQMSLKQGFGRLIRTEQDQGVVALLDSRVHRRGYGQRLLSQLPPARRMVDLPPVVEFLKATRPSRT